MRFLLCLFAVLTFSFAHDARAADDPSLSQAFPPTNHAECTNEPGGQKFLTWYKGSTGTVCVNGQAIFQSALSACQLDQYVTYDGSAFQCAGIPTCTARQLLTFNGGGFECRNTNIPTCSGNQALSFNGTSYECVARTDSIPVCSTNQYLTYTGSAYQCVTLQSVALPTCGANQMLTSNGSALSCTTIEAAQTVGNVRIFATPGTYTFTVPEYVVMTVEVWGGGASGGGSAGHGTNVIGVSGTASSFKGTLIAGGGDGGTACGSYRAGGGGGTASGGDINTPGNDGAPASMGWWRLGGLSTGFGAPAPNGGSGGSFSGDFAPGGDGGVPGGGGAGGYEVVSSQPMRGGGGGSGAYAKKTYVKDVILGHPIQPGTVVTVVVGVGGSRVGSPTAQNRSGKGGGGMLKITWE